MSWKILEMFAGAIQVPLSDFESHRRSRSRTALVLSDSFLGRSAPASAVIHLSGDSSVSTSPPHLL
jgi:hypothetical protein